MHALTAWFIRNPVAANLIMALILVAGFLTVSGIRIEGFPKLPASVVSVTTAYLNAYTDQVDEQITQKIEQALEGLDGVKKITSTSINGLSSVNIEKRSDHSLQKLLDDVRIRIDGIATFPRAAERPVIERQEFDFPALYILMDGQTDQRSLQRLTKQLKDRLLEQPEISRLKMWGEKDPEMRIEIKPAVLEKYGLSITDLAEKIRQSSLLFESGILKTKGAHILLRADNQAYYKKDFAAIPIIENSDGTRILLGDIAHIDDGYIDDDVIVRFNGQEAIGMELLIGRKENLLEIARVVNEVVGDFRLILPPEIKVSTFGDSSVYISERLELLRSNAFQGLFLVVLLLAIFLNFKLAFWVGMGIPISVAGAMAVMGTQWIDYSLNDITTFGLIIALGILVDDAVVVGESVFEERKKYKDPLIGTEKGVARVATATIFGVLTTVAAFSPMLMINNDLGKLLASFSGVVILALLFSLFESKFILPAHLAHLRINVSASSSKAAGFWKRFQEFAQGRLFRFRDQVYAPMLRVAIHHRYAVFIGFVAVAILGIGLVGLGKVRTVFFPEVPGQIIRVNMEMDARAPNELTIAHINKIDAIREQLNEEYVQNGQSETPPILHVLKIVTSALGAEMYAELIPSDQRPNLGTMDILKDWQGRVGQLEGTNSLVFSGSDDIGGGFAVQLFSKDEETLQQASEELIDFLSKIEGVSHLRDDLKGGQPEIHLTIRPEAQHLGFSTADIASQVSARFGGLEAQRIQRGNREVKVMIRNDEQARKTLQDLMDTRLKGADGNFYPLLSVARFESGYTNAYIARRNGKRVNTILAFVDKDTVSSAEVWQSMAQDFLPEFQKKYPYVEMKSAGELEEMGEMSAGLKRALLITTMLIYVLMAIPLKSYSQPFVIMAVIPFGFIGAVAGHLIMDVPLSLLSFFGMLALTGVVVNDSLVMMTRYNQARTEGEDIHSALVTCGVSRFQAIFLTTVTTVAGLMPLMSETSEQAQYLIPAAISLAYGEIFATAITLILIPVIIAIKNDIMGLFSQSRSESQET